MELFDRFLQERTYLKGVSPETLRYYRWVRRAFSDILAEPTKNGMLDCIQKLLAEGVSATSVNTYLRGFKAYVRWLAAEGHLKEVFPVQLLKAEQKVIATLPTDSVGQILKFTPTGENDRRIHTFICLLLDTGLRLSEGLSLRRDDIDFDNLVLKVKGKGSKYRLVPFSIECRKILFRFAERHQRPYLFSTRNGTTLTRRNAIRDMATLGKKLGIKGVRFSPHTLRHTFAVNYLRNGGNVFYLQRILGHSTLEMTNRYVRSLGIEDLQAVHSRLSLLSQR